MNIKNLLKQLFCKHKNVHQKAIIVADVPNDILMSYLQDLIIYKKCRDCDKVTIIVKHNHDTVWR